jgi:hypothetical protein
MMCAVHCDFPDIVKQNRTAEEEGVDGWVFIICFCLWFVGLARARNPSFGYLDKWAHFVCLTVFKVYVKYDQILPRFLNNSMTIELLIPFLSIPGTATHAHTHTGHSILVSLVFDRRKVMLVIIRAPLSSNNRIID